MKYICFSLVLFFCMSAAAQENFLIYTLQGNVVVMENNIESKAKVGRMLTNKAEVRVPTGGAISLICSESHLITLNKSGKFPLTNFKNQCQQTESSVTSNYLKYIWSQLTQKPGSPEKNRKQYMKNVGAVSRSINSIFIDPRFDTINYVNVDFPLTWKSYAEVDDFDFLLYSKKNPQVPILVIPTKEKSVAIKEIAKKMKAGEQYYWTAIVKGGKNEERKILNFISKDNFKKTLKAFETAEGTFEDEAAKAFRVAFLLEQAHYLGEAFEHYKKAAALQPEITVYASTLDAFKKDYGIE